MHLPLNSQKNYKSNYTIKKSVIIISVLVTDREKEYNTAQYWEMWV